MTLVDRYVAEVARRLPRQRRADISRELRSTLLDTLESQFGDASDEHAVEVLRTFGPPEKVAASYQPSNHYLIGPQWYGPFSTVLRIHLIALVGVLVAGFAFAIFQASFSASSSASSSAHIGRTLAMLFGNVMNVGLFAFGTIVLVFHLLERANVRVRVPEKPWNPRDLPDTPDHDLVGRGEAITIIVLTAAYLVVLYQLKHEIGWHLPDGRVLLNDVVRDNLSWIAMGALLTMTQYAVLLWQGRWHWYTRLTKFACDAFGVYVVSRLVSGVLAQQDALINAGVPVPLANLFMQIAMFAVPVIAALVLFDVVRTLWRSWSAARVRYTPVADLR